MKILHCLHQYHPARGGAENLMKGVSDRLAARGHDVRVLATTAGSTEEYFLKKKGRRAAGPAGTETIDGVAVTRVPYRRAGAAVLNKLRSAAWRAPIPWGDYWRMLSWGPRSRAYYREILTADVDVVAAGPLPTLVVRYAWRATKRRGLPLVIVPCFHTEDRYSFHNARYFRWLREADAVVCLTELEREYFHRVAGVALDRLTVIGVGIDFDPEDAVESSDRLAVRERIRAEYGLDGTDIVLFIGQHAVHKGIIPLVEAMEEIWRSGARRPDLIIAGNPTAHTAVIEARIARLPESMRRRVRLIKGITETEKRDLLRSADLFVSVSPFESFGIVYLEAWREKLAVIGCRRGAASRIIDPHRDGLLVADNHPRELAGAILELLDDPDLRSRMGERGYAKARETYRWDGLIDRWEDLYHGVRKNTPDGSCSDHPRRPRGTV
jgi:glycosyltransferase involved in cell wall biosynthesis